MASQHLLPVGQFSLGSGKVDVPTLQGERDHNARVIADLQARQESEQAMKEQALSEAQTKLLDRQQEAEVIGSKLREASVSFQLFQPETKGGE